MDKDVIAKEVKNLDAKKAVTQDDIPVKILKLNNDIFCQYLSQIFNESIETVSFPNDFKCADITLVYKKNRQQKENYRPVSIICYTQIIRTLFFSSNLSKH